jgi:predicted nucleic acid-binding protein
MIHMVSLLDKDPKWYATSSRWSLLEVARALRLDKKTKEIIELDLKELRSHKITFVPVSDKIMSEAEQVIASTDTFAADAVHLCTYKDVAKRSRLDGFLCDDRHFDRFKHQVPIKTTRDLEI